MAPIKYRRSRIQTEGFTMTSVVALPGHRTGTPFVSPLTSNLSRQLRLIGVRRRQLIRTNVAMPIAICAEKRKEVNPLLKFAVGGATEILRIFNRKDSSEFVSDSANPSDVSVADVDDLIAVLESDYKRSYFLTGKFTTSIYAEDCCFVDPTITFNGRDLYQRNLQLLVPFFEDPSLLLSSIEQGLKGDKRFIEAKWQLSVFPGVPNVGTILQFIRWFWYLILDRFHQFLPIGWFGYFLDQVMYLVVVFREFHTPFVNVL